MSQHSDDSSAERRPNIVLVMADDMGFSDIGCYGGEIETPTVDQLAGNGVRCTQVYNNARCCPTRASLLTGAYPHRVGIGWMTHDLGTTEEYAGDLSADSVTIAEVLGDAGYATYMTGKWHLTRGEYTDADASKHNWPLQRGFDRFYGIVSGAASYFSPSDLTRGNERIDPDEDYYLTDAISDEAAAFVRDHHDRDGDDPFFLYVSYTAPHWPLHATDGDIETYEETYHKGWDAIREERYERQIDMGLIDEDWEIAPQDAKPWDQLDDETREKMARKMAIYAAQIDAMDQGIGRVCDTLEETGEFENTLFLFLSDNGACAEGGFYGWDAPMGNHEEVGDDMTPIASYGRYWANTSNTPFRRYKHWIHEGGIATPLIAHWPDRIDGDGEFVDEMGHVIDIMATCLDVANATYPDEYDGNEIVPMDGTSLLPAFDGASLDREAIFWEHEANRGIRTDRWKLVSKGGNGRWELYDMETDRTELHDCNTFENQSDEHRETVERLAEMWKQYADDVGVYPLDGRTHRERLEDVPEHLEH